MSKYHRKPAVVEAIQFQDNSEEIITWVRKTKEVKYVWNNNDILSLELQWDDLVLKRLDYLVKDENNFYVRSWRLFEKEWELD